MSTELPRILDQPLAWFENHQGQHVFALTRDWIFGPLHHGEDVDSYPIEDRVGRSANVSHVPNTDVMVTWTMRPTGQIVILHLGELPSGWPPDAS